MIAIFGPGLSLLPLDFRIDELQGVHGFVVTWKLEAEMWN